MISNLATSFQKENKFDHGIPSLFLLHICKIILKTHIKNTKIEMITNVLVRTKANILLSLFQTILLKIKLPSVILRLLIHMIILMILTNMTMYILILPLIPSLQINMKWQYHQIVISQIAINRIFVPFLNKLRMEIHFGTSHLLAILTVTPSLALPCRLTHHQSQLI